MKSRCSIVGAGPAGLTAAITLARARGRDAAWSSGARAPSRLPRATGVSTRTMELLRSLGPRGEVRAGGDRRRVAGAGSPRRSRRRRPGTPVAVGLPTRAQSALVSPTGAGLRAAGPPRARAAASTSRSLAGGAGRARHRGGRRRQPRDGVARHARASATARASARVAGPLPDRRRRRPQHGPRARSASPCAGRATSPSGVGVLFRAPLWERGRRPPPRHLLRRPSEAGGRVPPGGPPDRWLYGLRWDLGAAEAERRTRDGCARIRRAAACRASSRRSSGSARSPSRRSSPSASASGSAFLVGDAAHRVTPRGGTGMNTAIHDGYDLGWKLAWVLRGWAGEALLDSLRGASAGRWPSTTSRARPTRTARSAASPRSCAPTSAAASPTSGCPARPGASRRSTCSPRPHALHRARRRAWDGAGAAPAPRRRSPSAASTPSPRARSGSVGAASLLARPDGVPAPA